MTYVTANSNRARARLDDLLVGHEPMYCDRDGEPNTVHGYCIDNDDLLDMVLAIPGVRIAQKKYQKKQWYKTRMLWLYDGTNWYTWTSTRSSRRPEDGIYDVRNCK